MLRLMETHPAAAVEARGEGRHRASFPRAWRRCGFILRQQEAGPPPVCPPVTEMRPELARNRGAGPNAVGV